MPNKTRTRNSITWTPHPDFTAMYRYLKVNSYVTLERLLSAGLLYILQHPQAREVAIARLIAWEQHLGRNRTPEEIAEFCDEVIQSLHGSDVDRDAASPRRGTGRRKR